MNYAQIRHYDTANGVGIRTTLFVSGCTHNCYNCFNKDYQNFNYGNKFTQKQIDEIINYLKEPQIKGLTILGGEPLEQNADEMVDFLSQVKNSTAKDIWIYSGDTYEDILKDENKKKIMQYCDVLVDGRFVEELKNLMLKFRGSSNQRIIDIKRSMISGKVVLMEGY